MWTRLILVLVLTSGGWVFHSPPADAGCVVRSTATYAEGTSLRDDECDTTGARKVTSGGAAGATGGTATAAAPTHAEGAVVGDSYDLAGNKRVTKGTLDSGEIQGISQETSMLAISGGVVRGTVGNLATGLTTNTTSTAATIPTGGKTIYGSVTGTGAVTQTQKVYGGITTGFTPATEGILLCTLTLTGTTTAVDQCPVISSNNLFYKVVTSGTTGTGATGVLTAQY